jgi:hypothetical protein
MGSNALFPFYQNFALDPNNNETFYLPTIASIWRKDNMKAAAFDTALRNAGWNHLSNIDVGNASQISAISVSVTPANRLFYGTSLGKVYRIDNANTGNPVPVEITGSNFPANAFVACIDANPLNADNIMVVFSNYGVQSLFHSNNGGSTWTAVGGNLEEHPDGSGSGPSVRWSEALTYQGEKVIFVGTSVGLFSSTELNGDSTVWMQEGPTTIGNVLVDMIDTRQTDGFIAVATHGNGVYSTYYKSTAGIDKQDNASALHVGNPYPVPAGELVSLPLDLADAGNIEIRLMNSAGHDLGTIFREKCGTGKQVIPLDVRRLPAGVYYLRVEAAYSRITRKIVVI